MLPSMAHIGAADSLTAVLAAALQPGTRQKAEQHLAEAERQPGYGLALVQTTIRHDVAPELRQMAALLLKNFIRYHWTPEAENFQVGKNTNTTAVLVQRIAYAAARNVDMQACCRTQLLARLRRQALGKSSRRG